MQKSISILIITYNRPDDLLDLLYSIKKQKDLSALAEILILNNASAISYIKVEDFAKHNSELKINYILSDENIGVSRGRNKLMSIAKGSLLLVLDDDILFQNDISFSKLPGIFEKEIFKKSNTGLITLRVLYYETKQEQLTAFPHKKYEEYKNNPVFLTSYYTGCAHILRKELLDKTGLYPTDFFYGMEEYDLAYRIINENYAIGYDNSITLEHKESPLGRQPNYQKVASQWVNKSKVSWRYLPFIFFITTAISWSVEFLLKTKFRHIGTYFKSWATIFKIPFSEKRTPLDKKGLDYLKSVKARLWY